MHICGLVNVRLEWTWLLACVFMTGACADSKEEKLKEAETKLEAANCIVTACKNELLSECREAQAISDKIRTCIDRATAALDRGDLDGSNRVRRECVALQNKSNAALQKCKNAVDVCSQECKSDPKGRAARAAAAEKPRVESVPEAPPRLPTDDNLTVYRVTLHGDEPVLGPENAPATIVFFGGYQEPMSSLAFPKVQELLRANRGKVRLIWKDLPMPQHERAEIATQFALAAKAKKGSKGYWAAHNILIENPRALEDSDLAGYAKKLRLNWKKIEKDMEAGAYDSQIEADKKFARSLGVYGTPTFFINGRPLKGYKSSTIEKMIAEEIQKGLALQKKGVKADRLYEELIKDGKVLD